jgi:hypothetical protein
MQFVGKTAEDSSLKNQLDHQQPICQREDDVHDAPSNTTPTAAETKVKSENDQVLETVSNHDAPILDEDIEKGVLRRHATRETHTSNVSQPYDDKDDFPEGGWKSWSVVVGAWCGCFAVFGLINSTAVLLDYFKEHQLRDYNESQLGWIFGLALFLTFFCESHLSLALSLDFSHYLLRNHIKHTNECLKVEHLTLFCIYGL